MPLVLTPKQLRLRGELFHQFGVLLSAGLPLLSALETLGKNPPSRSFGRSLIRLRDDIEQGFTFSEAVQRIGNWLPSFDVALLDAGERSGRLDECFRLLAAHYNERAQLARETLGRLSYPLLVVHIAVFLAPFPVLFSTGDFAAYLRQIFGVLAPVYGIGFLVVLACQGRHGEKWRSIVERVLRMVPVLGIARRHLALARLAAALEALINAGVSIIRAWALAGDASGSPALRRAVQSWMPYLEDGGESPSTMLSMSREIPELFSNLYHTGEVSGNLDDALRRIQKYYREDSSQKLRAISQWSPRLFYFAILAALAFRIVSFWTAYYSGAMNVLD